MKADVEIGAVSPGAAIHTTELQEQIDRGYLFQMLRHRAICLTCGWVGEWRPGVVQAEADGREHEEVLH